MGSTTLSSLVVSSKANESMVTSRESLGKVRLAMPEAAKAEGSILVTAEGKSNASSATVSEKAPTSMYESRDLARRLSAPSHRARAAGGVQTWKRISPAVALSPA